MTMPPRARWRALPRALRWPVLAVIALYAGYLLLGNLLLNTPLGPAALNRKPETFAMQWGTALTWWPGRLVLWDVALQGRSTRQRWTVSARRMRGQIRLLPLLHRQLLVPELQVHGVRAALQATTLPAAVANASAGATPPKQRPASTARGTLERSAGQARTTVSAAPPASAVAAMPTASGSTTFDRADGAASQSTTTARPGTRPRAAQQPMARAWTLQFDRIHAEQVQALSLHQLHIEGQGQVQLGLFKQLRGGPMELFPSRANFDSARVRWGQSEMLRNGQLRLDASIARHRPDQARGLALLQLTDALLAVHGDTAALDVTRNAQGRHRVVTRPGKGRADGELRWARGALQPGSQWHWRAPLHDSTRAPAALLGELTA